MKHTKGKWRVGKITSSFPKSIIIQTLIEDRSNTPFTLDICHVLPKVDGSREANAKLIAAAPKMLEALNVMSNYLAEDLLHYEDIGDEDALKSVTKANDVVQAAIKTATEE